MEYLQTSDEDRLLEALQNLLNQSGENELLNDLMQLLAAIQNLNFEDAQKAADRAISVVEDEPLKNTIRLFKNQLLLLILGKILTASEDPELQIQTLLNRIPILNEALQSSILMENELLIQKYLEQNIDNMLCLGLVSVHGRKLESAFRFLGKAAELLKENESNFPKQNSLLLNTLANLFIKIRSDHALLEFGKTTLELDPDQQDLYEIAFHYIQKALSSDETANYSVGLAQDRYTLAALYYAQGRIKEGIEQIKNAQALHEQLEDRAGILNDVILLGMLIRKSGQLDNAAMVYENALQIAMDLDFKIKIGHLNLLLGNLLYSQNKYEDSIKHLKTALVIFKQEHLGTELDLIESYTWIGQALRELQKLPDAKNFLTKILEVEEKSQSPLILIHIHAQLAITHLLDGNLEEFNNHYGSILSLNRELTDELLYANLEYQIGIAYFNAQKFYDAFKHLDIAFNIYHKRRNLEKLDLVLSNLAFVCQQLGELDLAHELSNETTDLLQRAALVQEKGGIPDMMVPVLRARPITATPIVPPEPIKIPSPPQPALRSEAELQTPPTEDTARKTTPTLETPPPKGPKLPNAVPVQEPESKPPASIPKPKPPLAIPIDQSRPQPVTPPTPKKGKPPIPFAVPIRDTNAETAPLAPPPPPHQIQPLPKSEPSPEKPAAAPNTEAEIPKLVGRQCPSCNFLITDPEFTFCPKCATKLPVRRLCPKCGFPVEDHSFKFCPKCANPLE